MQQTFLVNAPDLDNRFTKSVQDILGDRKKHFGRDYSAVGKVNEMGKNLLKEYIQIETIQHVTLNYESVLNFRRI